MPEQGQPQRNGPLLAFDVGAKVVGVALGSTLTQPRPLTQISVDSADGLDSAIDRLIAEWQPSALIVGRPLTLDGQEQPASQRARAFANRLRKRHDLPVSEVDERNTTRQARERFATARASGQARRKAGQLMDAMAAAVIMERYLATAPD
ncbi:MAG: Holliday junction resolvase RuvX [Xanthomonadales bacterium]|nr:Holliday junction resolvase RuvX [Xanthomonadales bacterium]